MELIPKQPLRCVVLVAIILLMPSPRGPVKAADALDVHVTPRVANEPATLRITIDVEPQADNRYVLVQADSDDFLRSSLIQLDGSGSAKRHDVRYKALPAGAYAIGVTLFGSTGIRATAHRDVIVVAFGDKTSGR